MIRTGSFTIAAFALLATSTASHAIDPAAARGSDTQVRTAQSDDQPRIGGAGGILGCTSSGSKQEIGAVAGGIIGGFLGNRIAGRGSRTLGTVLGGALGAAAGSAVGCKLQKTDQAKAERAIEDAVATGNDQSWQSDETGASGRVVVSDAAQTVSLAKLRLARGVDPANGYTQVNAAYVATSSVNVRSAPGTDAMVLGKLAAGQRVWVPASVSGQPWLLISDQGVARGYVSAPLLRRAMASNMASGCRLVTQTVVLPGETSETETLQACKGSNGEWTMTRV